MTVRQPAVAGRFYPGRPDTLTDWIESALSAVEVGDDVPAPAYVVPHAGYRFSGGTAAHVYARLRAHARDIERVVLIGPAHHVRLAGCAVPAADRWATPLGEVVIDTAGRDALVAAGHAVADDGPHAPEHSLEVQLPFLQRVLPDVPVLPVVAGPSTVDTVAALLSDTIPDGDSQPEPRADNEQGGDEQGDIEQADGERAGDGKAEARPNDEQADDAAEARSAAVAGTVLLCSTDLSHYHDDATARRLDEATIRSVVELRPGSIGTRDACGVFALRGLTALAARRAWTPRLLDYTTSADTAGGPDRVVGYGAFLMTQR